MKKLVFSLYLIGTLIIIKSIFRAGLIDGALPALVGCGFIAMAFYIQKYV
ncbi:MAG TPA: hypothetical protein VL995_02080 [Cellvibrio sp.]|nr:hypothetical protein [Cellvibrio sp.]